MNDAGAIKPQILQFGFKRFPASLAFNYQSPFFGL
jgi:hypothetical protein